MRDYVVMAAQHAATAPQSLPLPQHTRLYAGALGRGPSASELSQPAALLEAAGQLLETTMIYLWPVKSAFLDTGYLLALELSNAESIHITCSHGVVIRKGSADPVVLLRGQD